MVKNFNPFNNIAAAVTRKTRTGNIISAGESISVAEAIEAYTMGSAWAEGTEQVKGSIEPGKYADFIMLDRNPLETPVEELSQIKPLAVTVNGRTTEI